MERKRLKGVGRVLGPVLLAATLATTGVACAEGQTTLPGVDHSWQVTPDSATFVSPGYGAFCVIDRHQTLYVDGKPLPLDPTYTVIVDVSPRPDKAIQLNTTDKQGVACESYGGPTHPYGEPNVTYAQRTREQALEEVTLELPNYTVVTVQ